MSLADSWAPRICINCFLMTFALTCYWGSCLWKNSSCLPTFCHSHPQSTHTSYWTAFHQIWLLATWNEPHQPCHNLLQSPWSKWCLLLIPSYPTSYHILSSGFCRVCAEVLLLLRAVPVSTGIQEPLSIKDDCCSILTRRQCFPIILHWFRDKPMQYAWLPSIDMEIVTSCMQCLWILLLNKISGNPHFMLCEGLRASGISQGHVDLWTFMIPVTASARFLLLWYLFLFPQKHGLNEVHYSLSISTKKLFSHHQENLLVGNSEKCL